MSTPVDTSKSNSTINKPLWAAVGVLGVAVIAMGATLIRIQTRPEEPRLAVLAAAAPAPMDAASIAPLPVLAPAQAAESDPLKPAKSPVTIAHPAAKATKSVANNSSKGMDSTMPGAPSNAGADSAVNHPVAPVAKPICANCGTVKSVTPIQRDGTAGGGGAIAGGVLGAVVGNQVGSGNGKTLATILGAVGGGIAGNTVEKKMKKETVYQVQVHMEDGSTRTFEQATPASVGAKVIVDGNTLQPASR